MDGFLKRKCASWLKPMLKNQYGIYLLKVIDEKKRELDSDTFRELENKDI